MKVEFDIPAGEMGETVLDLFKSLTPEKKEELALSVLNKWFDETTGTQEFVAYKDKILREFRSGNVRRNSSFDTPFSELTDEDILRTQEARDKLSKFKTTKAFIIDEIKTEIINYAKAEIKERIQHSPEVLEITNVTFNEAEKAFPDIVISALIQLFALNLTGLQGNIIANTQKLTTTESLMAHMLERINNIQGTPGRMY